jgi:hypothetical protein
MISLFIKSLVKWISLLVQAKKGITLYKSNQTLEAHEAKTIIKNKILKKVKLKMTTKISGKQWANIHLD